MPRQTKFLIPLLLCALTAASGIVMSLNQPKRILTRIDLDAERRFQIIDGWAVYPRYWEDDKVHNRFDRSFEPHTEDVSRLLVDEVGINAVRVEIWSGLENPVDYWIDHYRGELSYRDYNLIRYEKMNDNDDPHKVNPAGFQFNKFDHRMESMVLPIKRALEARGEKMYVNVCYVDFSLRGKARQGSLSHADNPEEFAEFVLVFFERLRDKYGIEPDSFEVILEPDNTARWRGHQIGHGLVASARRLEANGFRPEFVAPSNKSMGNAIRYFDEMIEVPGVLDKLDTFAYHRYGKQRTSMVEDIRARAQANGLKTAMLEKLDAGIDVLLEDLLVGHVSSWQQWAVAGKSEWGRQSAFYIFVDNSDPENVKISKSRLSQHLSQVFRFVRRGAVRIAATSDNETTTSVAFINPDGGRVVVLRAYDTAGSVAIAGLPAGRYAARFIDDDLIIEDRPPRPIGAGETLTLELSRPGVLTVYPLTAE